MTGTLLAMKRIAPILLLVCALLAVSPARFAAQAPVPAPSTPKQELSTLTVHIAGLRNANGRIHLVLFRDSQAVSSRELTIDSGTSTAQTVFENLPHGVYAVYLYHDENMNGKMDSNFLGIPEEGYGTSNNPPKRPGKPEFSETNFKLAEATRTIEIAMIYWL
jgi:uncharacterized protein (DUF2141 family)